METPDELEFLKEAGRELVSHAEVIEDFSKKSRSEILFPYVFAASKRMSARAISRWLDENKGIQFSAASVAKLLRESDKYFESIAVYVQPLAEHLAEQFGGNAEELLFQPFGLDLLAERISRNHPGEDAISYTAKVENELRQEWFHLDEEIRFRCRPFFDFGHETENRDTAESE